MGRKKRRIKKKCLFCGKEMSVTFYLRKKRRFCSRKCRYEYVKLNLRILKKCPYCGKEFSHPPSIYRKFCSPECMVKYHREHRDYFRIFALIGRLKYESRKLKQLARFRSKSVE